MCVLCVWRDTVLVSLFHSATFVINKEPQRDSQFFLWGYFAIRQDALSNACRLIWGLGFFSKLAIFQPLEVGSFRRRMLLLTCRLHIILIPSYLVLCLNSRGRVMSADGNQGDRREAWSQWCTAKRAAEQGAAGEYLARLSLNCLRSLNAAGLLCKLRTAQP